MLPEICFTAGILYGIVEGTYRGILEPLLAGSAQKADCQTRAAKHPSLVEQILLGVQLSSEPYHPSQPHELLGLLCADSDAISLDTFFGLAIKRANKCVDWAPLYAQLCSQMKDSGEPTGRHIAVESAVRGRATAEYCRLSLRTIEGDAEHLQGSMRFLGSLFKEHLLPYALIHALVTDLACHSEKGMDEVHLQPLIALALVSLLHGCADKYVSAELVTHGQAAGQHARHLSNVLMRLRASVNADTFPDLCVDLLDVQFKLTGYASSICPAHQNHAAARFSADIPRPERMPSGDINLGMWPGLRQRGF